MHKNNCSLTGGETAEMPVYAWGNDFDLAGSVTGIAEMKNIVKSSWVQARILLFIGLESNGLHTNGFSLVRKIFSGNNKFKEYYNDFGQTLGKESLKITGLIFK